MKFKVRQHSGFWAKKVNRRRQPSMPQFNSSLPGEIAADAVVDRSNCFKLAKRINALPRRPMSREVMEMLCGTGRRTASSTS